MRIRHRSRRNRATCWVFLLPHADLARRAAATQVSTRVSPPAYGFGSRLQPRAYSGGAPEGWVGSTCCAGFCKDAQRGSRSRKTTTPPCVPKGDRLTLPKIRVESHKHALLADCHLQDFSYLPRRSGLFRYCGHVMTRLRERAPRGEVDADRASPSCDSLGMQGLALFLASRPSRIAKNGLNTLFRQLGVHLASGFVRLARTEGIEE